MGWVGLSSCAHVRVAARSRLSRDSTLDSDPRSESGQPLTAGDHDKPIMDMGELDGHSPGSSPCLPHGAAPEGGSVITQVMTHGVSKGGVPFCPIHLPLRQVVLGTG